MTAWWDGPGEDVPWAQGPADAPQGVWDGITQYEGWWDEVFPKATGQNGQGNSSTSTASGQQQGSDEPQPTPPAIYINPVPPPDPTTFAVKQPSPSLVQYSADTLPQQVIEDLLYEQIGGHELINISRHDTIDGQNIIYSLVRNLSILNKNFNPNNILAGQSSYNLQFKQYALDIANKLPYVSDDYPYGAIYLSADGDLVIEFTSIGNDEISEIEISTNGTIYRLGVA